MEFLKKNKFFILGFFVLSWVVFVNLFPDGYVFAGGDTPQFIELKDNFRELLFNWEGKASFFYFIFYVLGALGVNNSTQLSCYLAFIIFGAYISLGLFCRLIFPGLSDKLKTFSSLFYALNLYTLFLFLGNWGYSHFPSLYVFIPALTGLLIRFLKDRGFYLGVWFCLLLFPASSGFGNPAFALSLAIFFLVLLIFLFAFKYENFNKKNVYKLFLLSVFSLAVSAFWFLPLIPQIKSGVEILASTNLLDFDQWIAKTASPILKTVSLIHFSESYFPLNFPYKSLDFLKNFFIFISFLPFAVCVSGFFLIKDAQKRKLFLVFWGVALFFIMLIGRITAPFETVNHYIYHIWGFNTLRGFDKTAIYFPFLMAIFLVFTFREIKNQKIATVLMALILIIPLPFYLGKIQQDVSYRFSASKNYKTSSLSFLVKIPSEYYKIRDIINNDQEKFFVSTLPYHDNDGSGISKFSKWKLYGADITRFLYNKRFLDSNSTVFDEWNFLEEFNSNQEEKNNWMPEILGMMSAKYVIYHKDVSDEYSTKNLYKMAALEKEKVIQKLEDNEYFNLYEIDSEYFFPYISWQKEEVPISYSAHSIERNFRILKENSAPANFQEANPRKYLVHYGDNNFGENIVLSEPFNRNWKAYYVFENGKEEEIRVHFKARGYANGWEIENKPDIRQIIIEYYPIRLMRYGLAISLFSALFLIIYLLKYYYARIKHQKNPDFGQK